MTATTFHGPQVVLLADGVPALGAPRPWLGRLRIAWVADPDGSPVQLVQEVTP